MNDLLLLYIFLVYLFFGVGFFFVLEFPLEKKYLIRQLIIRLWFWIFSPFIPPALVLWWPVDRDPVWFIKVTDWANFNPE